MLTEVLLIALKWTALLCGAALLLRALVPRKTEKPYCPRCRYDMTGAPDLRCPECGKRARSERKLHRKPRKKRWIALALLLLTTSYGSVLGERARNHGWHAAVPTTVLIALHPTIERIASEHRWGLMPPPLGSQQSPHPTLGPIADALSSSLRDRAGGELLPMWFWQRHWLRSRAVALGFQGGQTLENLGGWASMTDAQRRALLRKTAPDIVLVRERTPLGAPLYANIYPTSGVGVIQVSVTPRFPGAKTVVVESSLQPHNLARNPHLLGHSSSECGPIEIDLRFTEPDSGFAWSTTLQTNAMVKGDIDDVLPVTESGALDRWLREWASPALVLVHKRGSNGKAWLEPELKPLSMPASMRSAPHPRPHRFPDELVGTSLCVTMELVAAGSVIGKGTYHAVATRVPQGDFWRPQHAAALPPLRLRVESLWDAFDTGIPIFVRIRSLDPERSLRAIDATKRWEGELTFPLSSIEAVDRTRPGGQRSVPIFDLRDKPLAPECIWDE